MSSRNLGIALVLISLVILAGWYFTKARKTAPANTAYTTPVVSASPSASASASAQASANVVKVTANGFDPAIITIKAGESVTWINQDSTTHNVSSAPHPTHTDYPPLNLGNFAAGQSVSLTFPTAGTYKYHDHLNPNLRGTVVVQ